MKDDTFRRALIWSVVAAGLVILILLAHAALEALLVIFAGVLVAIFIRALADAVARWTGLGPGWSAAVTVVALALLAAGGMWLIASRLIEQAGQLSRDLPRSLQQIEASIASHRVGRVVEHTVHQALTTVSWSTVAVSTATAAVRVAANAAVALFLGVLLAVNPALYVDGALRLVPPRGRDRTRAALHAVGQSLRWWLLAQALLMLGLGTMATVALWLIGMPLALLLGALTSALLFIPYVGAIGAFLITEVLALAHGPKLALEAALVYLGVHLIEAYVLAPLLHWDIVLLPPGLTISAQAVIFVLLGVPGLFISAPLTATVLVLVQVAYVEETLHEPIPEPVRRASRAR